MAWDKNFLRGKSDIFFLILAITIANLVFFHQESWLMNPVYIALFSILIYIGLKFAWKNSGRLKSARILGGTLLLGILFSLMVVAGHKIHADSAAFLAFTVADVFWFLLYFLAGCLLFFDLYLISVDSKIKNGMTMEVLPISKWNKKNWLLYSIILFIAWIPSLVTYFPGIVPDDATVSMAIVFGEMPWDNHFPVFYTLVVGGFLFVGHCLNDYNISIALYSVFQMLIMAAILGHLMEWLEQKGIKKILIYLGLAYFAAAPVFGNYAVVMWKDPVFSGILILLTLLLIDHVVIKPDSFLDKKILICYSGLIILASLMRNNGIYIGILLSAGLLIVYRKRIKRVLITSVVSLGLVWFITGPVYEHVFSAENVFVESIGIPLQQMARVVIEDGKMTEEEKAFMDHLLPLEKYQDYYWPFLADPVKWAPEFDTEYLDSHKTEFFKVWLSMLTKNFDIYVKQYLMGTYGFWHIGGETNYEFVKTDIAKNWWGMYQSQPFENRLGYPMQEKLAERYDYISTGLLVWILLFDIVLCWMRKKSIYMIPLLVLAGNWITLMAASPTAFGVRYIYVLVIGLPLMLLYPWLLRGGSREAGS